MRWQGIASIVEGDGEVTALPVLLRRLLYAVDPDGVQFAAALDIARPFRHPSGSLLKAGGLERALETVRTKYANHFIVLVVDSDDACPMERGQALVKRAKHAFPQDELSVVVAHREFESWFLAAAESLAGKRDLRSDLQCPPDPEAIRNAKGWLSERKHRSAVYHPTQIKPR